MLFTERTLLSSLKSIFVILATNVLIFMLSISIYYVFYSPFNKREWKLYVRNGIDKDTSLCDELVHTVVSTAEIVSLSTTNKFNMFELNNVYNFIIKFKIKPYDIKKSTYFAVNSYGANYDSILNIKMAMYDTNDNITISYYTTILLPTRKDIGLYKYWKNILSLLNIFFPLYNNYDLITLESSLNIAHKEKSYEKATKKIQISLFHLCSGIPPQLSDIIFYIQEESTGLRYIVNSYPNATFTIAIITSLVFVAIVTIIMVSFSMRSLYHARLVENITNNNEYNVDKRDNIYFEQPSPKLEVIDENVNHMDITFY